jgi:hypothetical protein
MGRLAEKFGSDAGANTAGKKQLGDKSVTIAA